MKTLCRVVMQASYFLGLISLLLSFLFRFVPAIGSAPYARGALICSGVFFLCGVASYTMTRLDA
jgi:vacuolar-type H+-ATPase subunit I/STV1